MALRFASHPLKLLVGELAALANHRGTQKHQVDGLRVYQNIKKSERGY